MATLTADELAMVADTDVLGYIHRSNAARTAQAEAEGWTFWTLMPESDDFVAEFANVYDLEHMYAMGTYSDVYKDVYCCRPSHSVKSLTLGELEAEIEAMSDRVQVDEN